MQTLLDFLKSGSVFVDWKFYFLSHKQTCLLYLIFFKKLIEKQRQRQKENCGVPQCFCGGQRSSALGVTHLFPLFLRQGLSLFATAHTGLTGSKASGDSPDSTSYLFIGPLRL